MSESTPWSAPYPAMPGEFEPAGYAWLVRRYQLRVLGHWRWTFIADKHVRRELDRDGVEVHVLPPPRRAAATDLAQLLFALRYDGLSLPICRALFAVVDVDAFGAAVVEEVQRTPTGGYVRRVWYLFEALTGRRLPLEDVHAGNYVPLLDPSQYVTTTPRPHRRQRVNVNLLGTLSLAPMIRRTPALAGISAGALRGRIDSLVGTYDDDTLRRAVSYLYTRETTASYEIEHERPPRDRAERFIALLKRAGEPTPLSPALLSELQRALVDPRFADDGWRAEEVYVGESLGLARQRVHFVAPKAADLGPLMAEFFGLPRLLLRSPVDPIVAAAVLSFLFVLLHPFTDGNGRVHRWLIHWALAQAGVTPANLILPVSAVMLGRRAEYDAALESFSTQLMRLLDYRLDDEGRIHVRGETIDLYRHPDLTAMTLALARWLDLTVDQELAQELELLLGLDAARREIQARVDLPDRQLYLFITLCRQNGGRLSANKREKLFSLLRDDEVTALEEIVARHLPMRRLA